jgi:chaperonin GroEL (HSP60 family)
MKKGIQIAVEAIVNELAKLSFPIITKSQIESIATISANG